MGMKKLAALVIALALCLTAVGAMAVTIKVPTDKATLGEAILAANHGDKIVLEQDVLDGKGEKINKNLTIDFGGHTYNFVSPTGSTGTVTLGFQVLEASERVTMINGKLTCTPGKGIKRLIQSYADLTLIDMELDGSNLDEHDNGTPNITASFNNGMVNVKGETTIIADNGDYAFDSYDGYEKGVEVIVDTQGQIIGKVDVDGESGSNYVPKLTINNVGSGSVMAIGVKKGKANLNNLPVGTQVTADDAATNVFVNNTDIVANKDIQIVVPEMVNVDGKAYSNDLVFSGKGSLTVKSTDNYKNIEGVVIYPMSYQGEPLVYVNNTNLRPDAEGQGKRIGVDDPTLEAMYGNLSDLSISNGSIKVTMTEAFLNKLTPGEYGVNIFSLGGTAVGTFTVAPAAVSADLPQTGDNSSLLLWGSLLAMAMVGFVASRKTRLN